MSRWMGLEAGSLWQHAASTPPGDERTPEQRVPGVARGRGAPAEPLSSHGDGEGPV